MRPVCHKPAIVQNIKNVRAAVNRLLERNVGGSGSGHMLATLVNSKVMESDARFHYLTGHLDGTREWCMKCPKNAHENSECSFNGDSQL
jgi:hypothetical protein